MRRVALLTIPIALLAGALAACSSDTASTDDATSVGGTAVCDEATLTTAVEESLAASPDGESLVSLDGFECADGWAVTFPTVTGSPGDEEGAYQYTQVFQAEGQFWVPDRKSVV